MTSDIFTYFTEILGPSLKFSTSLILRGVYICSGVLYLKQFSVDELVHLGKLIFGGAFYWGGAYNWDFRVFLMLVSVF